MESRLSVPGDGYRYLAQTHMNTNDDFNAEYVACYEQYCETAEHMRPYDFYVQATSEGVSKYYASCLLRDCYGMNLMQCKRIMDLHATRLSSSTATQDSQFNPDQVCEHLAPILQQLESEYGVVTNSTRNGKGWGFVALINELPKSFAANSGTLPDCVTISNEHGMISCSECWSNIADHDRYASKWG